MLRAQLSAQQDGLLEVFLTVPLGFCGPPEQSPMGFCQADL